jgi:hypothetical protein
MLGKLEGAKGESHSPKELENGSFVCHVVLIERKECKEF